MVKSKATNIMPYKHTSGFNHAHFSIFFVLLFFISLYFLQPLFLPFTCTHLLTKLYLAGFVPLHKNQLSSKFCTPPLGSLLNYCWCNLYLKLELEIWLSVIGGLDYWNGLLEWTTGMDFDLFFLFFFSPKCIYIEELV